MLVPGGPGRAGLWLAPERAGEQAQGLAQFLTGQLADPARDLASSDRYSRARGGRSVWPGAGRWHRGGVQGNGRRHRRRTSASSLARAVGSDEPSASARPRSMPGAGGPPPGRSAPAGNRRRRASRGRRRRSEPGSRPASTRSAGPLQQRLEVLAGTDSDPASRSRRRSRFRERRISIDPSFPAARIPHPTARPAAYQDLTQHRRHHDPGRAGAPAARQKTRSSEVARAGW